MAPFKLGHYRDSEVAKGTRATIEEFVGWKRPKAVIEAKKP